jgi:glycosyltransferase involved in cell wall biosynthesis
VGTNAGGIPEIVRNDETGYLIPVASPEALADAINRLLDAPETAVRLGQQARVVVNNEFSINAMVTGNLRVYHGLVGRQD